jgi:hypothetical protein
MQVANDLSPLLDIPPKVRNNMDALGLLPCFSEERSEDGKDCA